MTLTHYSQLAPSLSHSAHPLTPPWLHPRVSMLGRRWRQWHARTNPAKLHVLGKEEDGCIRQSILLV